MKLHYPPEYVLDKMKWYEIVAALKHQSFAIMDSWEQARLIAFIIAQANSKERLEMDSIIKFPWDEADKEEPVIIKDTDAQRQSKIAEELINKGLI